jgi:hypothetical protein
MEAYMNNFHEHMVEDVAIRLKLTEEIQKYHKSHLKLFTDLQNTDKQIFQLLKTMVADPDLEPEPTPKVKRKRPKKPTEESKELDDFDHKGPSYLGDILKL